MGRPYVHRLRVRYGECDPQGVVFNAHYLSYFDVALTELFRAAVGGYAAMTDRGIDLVVAEARLRYRAGARFDDELAIELTVVRLGTTSMVTRQRVRRADTDLVEGEMRHVFVDPATSAKAPIPAWLRGALAPYVVGDGA